MKRSIPGLLALLLTLPAGAADGLREGQWEYRTTLQIPGMPAMPKLPDGMQMPQVGPQGMTLTHRGCVSSADPVPRTGSDDSQCTTTRLERQGTTVIWAATCTTPRGKADAEGRAQYSGDRMEGTMRLRGQDERGHPFEMTQTMSGRYLGPCTAP